MKTWKVIVLIVIGTLIIIQFFPTYTNESNEMPATDLIQSHEPPSQVSTLLHNACYDCHSNNTDYPWYNQVQPYAWMLEGHIKKGKADLNFNEFDTYSKAKQRKKLKQMYQSLQENTMPLGGYKILHAEGRLTKNERKQIKDWIEKELRK